MSELPIESSVGETQATPRKIGHRLFDLILALTAIFISAISLYVAIEHGKIERELVSGNTWPFVGAIYSNEYGPNKDVAFGVVNGGVGPAKLKWVEVSYKGQPMRSNLDLLRQCCGLPSDPEAAHKALPQGVVFSYVDETILRPGDTVIMLGVHRLPGAPEISNRLSKAISTDLSFKTCYCSVLDECWIGDMKTTKTEEVEVCPVSTHPFDVNGR
ncbi:hypothetical protein [Asticcacaulis sp. 201]|uniref:hypothetical protein n=1 Tax=Asticcacaulis sp. 201 TaxID=3028787 RepID=UPI002916177B|nr:hypothetical protein [Asticcacaulis sp. 201]MDV6331239.1 hypothetical protein [Asticcacaulis sp. 201]